jgi:DNA-directed RNA polymerase specialized sigma subunit
MKIPLNAGGAGGQASAAARYQALERDLKAAKRGDWEARHRIEASLLPLLKDLAKKRASENGDINTLIEAGKQGIATAIKKYKAASGADRFQVFALRFIEDRMDKPRASARFFARLFGG